LAVTGELAVTDESDLFDEALEEAVRRFQASHGLESDGAVGRGTLAALNVTAAQRVRQIEVNLERWRWLPQKLGDRYVLVNIAAFHLYVVEGGSSILDMRVVVGRPVRRTPVFSDRMTYLVFNPYWEIPELIAVQDIVPQVRRDLSYLAQMGIKVYQGWGAKAREIDPATINWATEWAVPGPKKFPYRLRQEPGPSNALGRIKFMLPNDHDVYLHDTPARNLFRKEARTFSSGCIRIEKPLELAEYLLQNTPLAAREALEAALASDHNRIVSLPSPLPVHLLYWTSWVDTEGVTHFRQDIYGRDEPLRLALDQPPPAAEQMVTTSGPQAVSPAGI
jgi:murein L,D-transpeptidase YcbB/YkuD